MATTEVTSLRPGVTEEAKTAAAPTHGFFLRPAVWGTCLTLLIAIGLARIISTYHVFNHTIDEPSHIACGIEWWEKGTYTIEPKHAPLARISEAMGPYLAGVRGTGATKWEDTYPILSADGHYWRNLILGRIGNLPFFVIATVVLFFWTKRLHGAPAALAAAAVFTFLPPVLAHSAVATTDIPLTAMFCWALYAFTLWLRDPNQRSAAHFGVATGLAVSAKFSTFVFLPACGFAVLVLYAVAGGRNWRALLRSSLMVALCAFAVVWAVYRFSHAPLSEVTKLPERAAAKVFGKSSGMTAAVHQVSAHLPIPAPELFAGLRVLRQQNQEGHRSYLLGHVKNGGWWYFFIVALAVKTPLSVLLLALGGVGVLLVRYTRNRGDWESMVPLSAAAMLLLVTMPSRLDMGVRYVMPVFFFLCMLAATALWALWQQQERRTFARAAAVLLLGWLTVSSVRAHPDYLAYFNEFGGKDPGRLLVISDLDWGQDLWRVSNYLREHQITSNVGIAYDGWFVPESLGFPPGTENILSRCNETPTGWVVMQARRARVHRECYPWLAGRQPVAAIGKTMWLYDMNRR